ncbi:helix-turn-helix domain-containing protein, partial [Salinicoccus roseus]
MIGQRIKEIRNNNNLTQEELADGIISRTYLSLIEKGSVHPSTNVLIKLSERLNCSVNDFMQEVSHFRYNDVEIL